MENAIEVNNIIKRFGKHCAVNNVSFTVKEGDVFGLLGPNGAGKTTLVRILTTLIKPTSGDAKVAGYNIITAARFVRKSIGVVSQAMTTDLDLTARENLSIYGEFYEIPKKKRNERIEYLLDVIGLKERVDDLVASYSGGMRRRLEIARGLINTPKILFLDEPTIGLDPQSRRTIWNLIQKIRKENRLTISLTTHYMEEAEAVCDSVAIIDNGKIEALASPEELKMNIPGGDIIDLKIANLSDELFSYIKSLHGVEKVSHENDIMKIYLKRDAHAISFIDEIRKFGAEIGHLSMRQKTLEDVFIHYTGQSIREGDLKKVSFFIGAGVPRKMNQ